MPLKCAKCGKTHVSTYPCRKPHNDAARPSQPETEGEIGRQPELVDSPSEQPPVAPGEQPPQPICKHGVAGCPECKTGIFAAPAAQEGTVARALKSICDDLDQRLEDAPPAQERASDYLTDLRGDLLNEQFRFEYISACAKEGEYVFDKAGRIWKMVKVTGRQYEVLGLAEKIVDLCHEHTSSRVIAVTATSVATAVISAEWNPEEASDGAFSAEVLKSQPSA